MSGSARHEHGFTLIEMLAAMMILAFGLTTLLGVFSSGLATEQNAEILRDASRLATTVRESIEEQGLLGDVGAAVPDPIRDRRDPAFPGLAYDVDFEAVGEDASAEVFVTVTVRWLRGGAGVAETLRFPLPRGRPLYLRLRDATQRSANRR